MVHKNGLYILASGIGSGTSGTWRGLRDVGTVASHLSAPACITRVHLLPPGGPMRHLGSAELMRVNADN